MPRGRRSKLYNVTLSYECEWVNCSEIFTDENQFKYHLLGHFKIICDQVYERLENPLCGICNTLLNVDDLDAVERHSFFHSWIIQLRTKGKRVQTINDWPSCLSDPSSRNIVPELPTKFECGWEYCDFKTNDVSTFIGHVSRHPEEYTDSRYPRGAALKCLWEDCSYVALRLRNLSCHLDTHTQTKRAACPTCGLLVVDARKLEDHLKRQQIHLLDKDVKLHHSIKPVKCSRCRRVFSTQRLLASHMKRHINTVKCPFCEMTAWGKSALDRHILFRHSDEKPYPCPYCSYQCKISSGLSRHIRIKHKHIESSKEISVNVILTHDDKTDLDADRWSSQCTSVPVHGPLAQAGAISWSQSNNAQNSILTNSCTTTEPTDSFVCPHEGCGFKTNKQSGYLIHIGRKHNTIPTQYSVDVDNVVNDDDSIHLASPQTITPKTRLYICHICPVVKRRGAELSKHLVRDHHLTRPSGHVRFTYTISKDGHYRLQLTRLDTVPVAAELLGETVVKTLLVSNKEKLALCD